MYLTPLVLAGCSVVMLPHKNRGFWVQSIGIGIFTLCLRGFSVGATVSPTIKITRLMLPISGGIGSIETEVTLQSQGFHLLVKIKL